MVFAHLDLRMRKIKNTLLSSWFIIRQMKIGRCDTGAHGGTYHREFYVLLITSAFFTFSMKIKEKACNV